MKYVNQLAHPDVIYVTHAKNPDPVRHERGKSTTIAQSGCGVCSVVMIADRLLIAKDFNLEEAIQLSYDSEANYRAGTDAQIYFPAFAKKMGKTEAEVSRWLSGTHNFTLRTISKISTVLKVNMINI